MSKSVTESKPLRMFVALDLPRMVQEDIAAWGETELSDPALRRVESESLHVTLAFLGDRPPSDVEPITEVIEWAADRPVLMELGGPVRRPERGRPRLVALPVLGGPVEGLEERLGRILAYEGLYTPEKRPYWPHVTVARVRSEGDGSGRPMRVEIPSGPSPTAPIGWFDGVRISLYRSELQSRGARYVPLAQVELPGAGWQ
jgi:RNA 2',3'-cyclic 3'-phosphodiesterase